MLASEILGENSGMLLDTIVNSVLLAFPLVSQFHFMDCHNMNIVFMAS